MSPTPEENFEIYRKSAYESGQREAKAEATGDALEARRLLWLNHGHPKFLYGDDGEMQCQACGETWDYKRAPLENVVHAALETARKVCR